MSATDVGLRSGSSPAEYAWRPLPMMGTLAGADYPGFVLAFLWLSLTALCVWWPIADTGPPGFAWDRWVVHFAGAQETYTFYVPWVACVCLVMWLGLEWAAFPAYLATLFSTLHKDMPWDLAVVNALHNPLALGTYYLFYSNYKGDYSLRSARSWGWFILAGFAASMVSSVGAFISQLAGVDIR